MSIQDNMDLLNQYRDKFMHIFNVPLTRWMHPLYGFDIGAFDDWIKTPADISLRDHIFNIYGDEGVQIVLGVLGVQPKSEFTTEGQEENQ
ncbi:MAG: hypothetical protein A2W25_12280 [candidate division Zixibacteria bacterium RBG_16_53_22]|nr:MAG: hypothetical protein A2W25_12280 [candidate division Zixibacteria bacterium RBG_16_53_22]